jgi:AcrR family transcriptional regulator
VEVIVSAALALIDREGLSALTTRRLAADLGTFQPAIYRRIAGRDALLDLIADAVMAEVRLPDLDPSNWRAWLRECALGIRDAWKRHPHAAALMHHGGAHPAITHIVEGILDAFVVGGFSQRDLAAAMQVYLGYVFGTTMLESTGRANPRLDGALPEGDLAVRVQGLARAGGSRDEIFGDGLDIVLDGIAARRGR